MNPSALETRNGVQHNLSQSHQFFFFVVFAFVVVNLGEPPNVLHLKAHGSRDTVNPGDAVVTQETTRLLDPNVDVTRVSDAS